MKLIVSFLFILPLLSFARAFHGQVSDCPEKINRRYFQHSGVDRNCRVSHDGKLVFMDPSNQINYVSSSGEIIKKVRLRLNSNPGFGLDEVIPFPNGNIAILNIDRSNYSVSDILFFDATGKLLSHFVWKEGGRRFSFHRHLIFARENNLRIVFNENKNININPVIKKRELEKAYRLEVFVEEHKRYYDIDFDFARIFMPLYEKKQVRDGKCNGLFKVFCHFRAKRWFKKELKKAIVSNGLDKKKYKKALRKLGQLNAYSFNQLYQDNNGPAFKLHDAFYTLSNHRTIVTHSCPIIWACSRTSVNFVSEEKSNRLTPNTKIEENTATDKALFQPPIRP